VRPPFHRLNAERGWSSATPRIGAWPGGSSIRPDRSSASRWLVAGPITLTLLVARPAVADTPLVEFRTGTRYRANASDPGIGTSWTVEAFNDAAWGQGTHGIGYETAPPGVVNLLGTTVPSNTRSAYSRTHFQIDDPGTIGHLWFGADYDDGYVAWINGVEVARSSSMPSGTPSWNSVAATHESSNGVAPNYGTLADITAVALPVLHAGDNVLAVGVWNATGASSDLVIVPRLALSCNAPVTRGPYLQRGTSTGIVVRWRTSTPTSSRVRFGAAPGALSLSSDSTTVTTEHEVALVGLSPSTRYYYAIGSMTETCAGDDANHVFVTAPPTGSANPLRVWVTGDSGMAIPNARAVRDAYAAYTGNIHTDLWLLLGDNAYTEGTDAQYQAGLFDNYPDRLRTTVVWPTLGNHDGISADSATQTGPYYNIFTLPKYGEAGGVASGTEAYYSFDWGNLHFVCLESFETNRAPSGAMLTWAQTDIAATNQDWVIAFWHHPPYSKGSHDSDVEIELVEMRRNALPVLEGAGVDLVMAGHSHAYERSYLLDGHYGLSGSLSSTMKKDDGNGRIDGDGSYWKTTSGPAPRQGTVYMVNGTASQASGGALNHPAMFDSRSELGSVVLDVRGRQLDIVSINVNGVVRDHFTMVKGSPTPPVAAFSGTPTDGVAPLAVQFTDLSANTPTLWEWDFEDNGVVDAGTAGASHVYGTPGLYGVRLVARNGFGSDTAVQDDFVCVRSANGAADVDSDGVPDGMDDCPCGNVCDDANACTVVDTCAGGTCAGTTIACDDSDPCTDDSCTPTTGCVFAPITAPPETQDVSVAADKTTYSWAAATFATWYDVVRGSLAALPVGPGAGDEFCFDDLGGTTLSDLTVPDPDTGFWYLSRGENTCGNGTYGTQGVSGAPGPPRVTTTCP
jgi:PKD repeat protein